MFSYFGAWFFVLNNNNVIIIFKPWVHMIPRIIQEYPSRRKVITSRNVLRCL